MIPIVIPAAAGVSIFGNLAVVVVSALGLLLVVLLAVRATRLRGRAIHDDQPTEGATEVRRA